ncbi:preprotein translocase subunit YajC [Novosphingopyxis sp.]|uniref:preprotein translocase subunit YajC n=1 Tax=Novosphingopyxis sp. TaxID=2709690 RepID=UPI003B5B7936
MTSMLIHAQAASGGAGAIMQFLPLVLIFIVFYWFLIRPQQKRAKEHAAKVAAVVRGDDVVTGGGLLGKVTRVSEDHVEVELAKGVQVRAVKSTIADVIPKNSGKTPAND